jgi:predicted membrane channel-forming protein YqfA (hemolysin III family)
MKNFFAKIRFHLLAFLIVASCITVLMLMIKFEKIALAIFIGLIIALVGAMINFIAIILKDNNNLRQMRKK